jgi:hypothetical protein
MDATNFLNILAETPLISYQDYLSGVLRPAFDVVCSHNEVELAGSRYGGSPDLPEDFHLQEDLAAQSHLGQHWIFRLMKSKLMNGYFGQMSYLHIMKIFGMLYIRVKTIFWDTHHIVHLHTIQFQTRSGFRYLQLILTTN